MPLGHALTVHYATERATFDLIAVQGLWADPEWTWEKRGVSLLSDLLPHDIPDARIMAFGSKSSSDTLKTCRYYLERILLPISMSFAIWGLASSLYRILGLGLGTLIMTIQAIFYISKYFSRLRLTSVSEIENQSHQLLESIWKLRQEENFTRPIVLLGHSFGGLVIKQATISASIAPRYKEIARQFKAFVFLGTPHRGSRLATNSHNWWFRGSYDIRGVLQTGSEVLKTLDNLFMDLPAVRKNMSIYCFFEERPSRYGPLFLGISMITVDRESASIPGRPSIGLDVRHSYLVKYDRRDDPNYIKIVQAIRASVKS